MSKVRQQLKLAWEGGFWGTLILGWSDFDKNSIIHWHILISEKVFRNLISVLSSANNWFEYTFSIYCQYQIQLVSGKKTSFLKGLCQFMRNCYEILTTLFEEQPPQNCAFCWCMMVHPHQGVSLALGASKVKYLAYLTTVLA